MTFRQGSIEFRYITGHECDLCFFHQLLDQITGFRRKKVEISVCKEVVIVEVRGKSRTHNGGYRNITSMLLGRLSGPSQLPACRLRSTLWSLPLTLAPKEDASRAR
jgi:hypothetical protein